MSRSKKPLSKYRKKKSYKKKKINNKKKSYRKKSYKKKKYSYRQKGGANINNDFRIAREKLLDFYDALEDSKKTLLRRFITKLYRYEATTAVRPITAQEQLDRLKSDLEYNGQENIEPTGVTISDDTTIKNIEDKDNLKKICNIYHKKLRIDWRQSEKGIKYKALLENLSGKIKKGTVKKEDYTDEYFHLRDDYQKIYPDGAILIEFDIYDANSSDAN